MDGAICHSAACHREPAGTDASNKLTRCLLCILRRKLYSSEFMSWNDAAKWWFSIGERSLYNTASPSDTRMR